MGAKLGGSGAISEINMTPLIDIVLVVLIIMMVNIPIQVEEMGIKLPAEVEQKEPPPPNPDQLVVMLYEDGRLALTRRLMDEETLFAELTRRLRPMEKKIVFIDAFPTTPYGKVVDFIDMAKEAGAEKVSFAKMKAEGPAEPTSIHEGTMPRGIYPGSPSVVGAMTEKQADTQFKPLLGSVRACYDAGLARNPTLSGRLIVLVNVGPEGEVMSTEKVSTTLTDPEVVSCVMELLPALTYEPMGYPNTAAVVYPLLFSPG